MVSGQSSAIDLEKQRTQPSLIWQLLLGRVRLKLVHFVEANGLPSITVYSELRMNWEMEQFMPDVLVWVLVGASQWKIGA